MQFADSKTDVRYTGTLIEDPAVDYRRGILILTPLAGGSAFCFEHHDKHRLVLTEATLNDISLLDGAGFTFRVHPTLPHRWARR